LREGTPIVAGGPDFIMALIGTAALEPGMICDRAGSSEGINLCLDRGAYRFLREKQARGGLAGKIRLLPHAVPGIFNAGYVIPESGALFERYRARAAGGKPGTGYETLMRAIVRDADHPGRAVLETMAAHVRAALASLREALDGCEEALMPPGSVRLVLSGGQAKSRLWNRMKAALTGAVLFVPEIPDGELAGDAVIGALFLEGGASGFPDAARLKERARSIARIAERCDPPGA
jgi:xylulokinase